MFGIRTHFARRRVYACQSALVAARDRYRAAAARGDDRGAGQAWPALASARVALMAAERDLASLVPPVCENLRGNA